MVRQAKQIPDWLLLGGISAVAYMLFLGAPPLFDWDEINFAESAREMIVTGNYFQVQINYKPFWEKPPLFFWMQVFCMRIFGVNEFAARLPNAIVGVGTILTLFHYGRQLKNQAFGRILALLYLGTMLPFIYFKSGIIDPVFNLFIFLGLYHLLRFEQLYKLHPDRAMHCEHPWTAGTWVGLATLTKGPVALLVTMLTYFLYKLIYDRLRIPIRPALKFFGMWAGWVFVWYGLETAIHGPWFLEEFIKYQIDLFSNPVAGHEQPFYYHFVVFLLGCFPLSAFTFRAMGLKNLGETQMITKRFMMVWFWVVLILFSVATTKIVHYSSMLYFSGVFLSALYLYEFARGKRELHWEMFTILGLGIFVWGGLPSLINLVENNLPLIQGMLKDPMAVASMSVEVHWTGYEWVISAIFLLGLIWNLQQLRSRKVIVFLWFQVLFASLFINPTYKWIVPKVALYTQGAPQAFFSKLATEDVYLATAYKSYLPYFYGRVRLSENPKAQDLQWLREGEIDKDVYLAAKVIQIDDYFRSNYRQFEQLYEEGGYVFFRRRAPVQRFGEVSNPLSTH